MSGSEAYGDRPRDLPSLLELKGGIDLTEREGSPAWDWKVGHSSNKEWHFQHLCLRSEGVGGGSQRRGSGDGRGWPPAARRWQVAVQGQREIRAVTKNGSSEVNAT